MRGILLGLVSAGLLASCAPGVAPQRHASDPRVFSGTPRCAYEVVGAFSRAPELLREIESRGGDAAILVKEETANTGAVNTADSTIPRFYSGQVVRFTDRGCRA